MSEKKNLNRVARATTMKLAIALVMTVCLSSAYPQADTLRIATYNLLNFPGADGATRINDFVTVVQAIDPDILVVQEVQSQAGVNMFLTQVMNAGGNLYQTAPFGDGPDTNNSVFFKQDRIILLAVDEIRTALRNISEYTFLASGQELLVYSLHLKAGSTDTDQRIRDNETTVLRNHLNNLPANSNFIVAGDYNIRSAAESAFVELIESQADNDGRLFDPINQIGEWHNNGFFVMIHTQSTRTTSFGDGSTGGLDDRFDMMLVSNSILKDGGIKIVPSSYRAFGNDGDHFNAAINAGANFAVPAAVADALHQVSDHLPVVASFVFGTATSVTSSSDPQPDAITLFQNYPNPFNAETTISYSLRKSGLVSLRVFNISGEEVASLVNGVRPAGEHAVHFDTSKLASGVYLYRLTVGNSSFNKKLLLLK